MEEGQRKQITDEDPCAELDEEPKQGNGAILVVDDG
jgi:hypothetical protein